jgi:hypothetical protein
MYGEMSFNENNSPFCCDFVPVYFRGKPNAGTVLKTQWKIIFPKTKLQAPAESSQITRNCESRM